MIFRPTSVVGAFLVEWEPRRDERGFFARTFCREEFRAHGLVDELAQCGVSFSERRGTLRGLHLQRPPHEEAKLVRCTRGAIFDVVVDLRPGSPSYRRWACAELRADAGRMLYVPPGCAHGLQTLEDGTEVSYQMSAAHHPESAAGVRWDDPTLAIPWPVRDPVLSASDRALPLLGTRPA